MNATGATYTIFAFDPDGCMSEGICLGTFSSWERACAKAGKVQDESPGVVTLVVPLRKAGASPEVLAQHFAQESGNLPA